MLDITDAMNRYRDAARVLWNAFIVGATADPDAVDAFDEIRSRLFDLIVLRSIDMAGGEAPSIGSSRFVLEPIPAFDSIRLVPNAGSVPVHVNRGNPKTPYWDARPERIGPGETDLLFIDCFDWDVMGFREFHYYRAEIRGFRGRPDLEGRQALLSVQYVRVYA